MSRSRHPRHPHYARTSCGVCQLDGGHMQRRRALAAEGVPTEYDPRTEPMPDDDIWDGPDDTVYMPDWAWEMLDGPQHTLAVPLMEGARFA